jgi:hypothetical protein
LHLHTRILKPLKIRKKKNPTNKQDIQECCNPRTKNRKSSKYSGAKAGHSQYGWEKKPPKTSDLQPKKKKEHLHQNGAENLLLTSS